MKRTSKIYKDFVSFLADVKSREAGLILSEIIEPVVKALITLVALQAGYKKLDKEALKEIAESYYSNNPTYEQTLLLQLINILELTELQNKEENERSIPDLQKEERSPILTDFV